MSKITSVSRQKAEVSNFANPTPFFWRCISQHFELLLGLWGPFVMSQRLLGADFLGCVRKAAMRFSLASQFRSGFVLVWFVERVVYGKGLYFLEFDELQIKRDQMNGPVSRGCSRTELWFCVKAHMCMHTHTHSYTHRYTVHP